MENPAPIPEYLTAVTPSLNLSDAATTLEFYREVFGAEELYRMPCPDGSGRIMHGEMKIRDAVIMFADEDPEWNALSPQSTGGAPLSLNLYVEDCDAVFRRAIEAGAREERPPTSYPWGERSAMIVDPSGYRWAICTHIENVTPEQVAERLANWNPEG